MQPNHKLVPVVSDFCVGCSRCINACPHGCLKSVWDFATLDRPDTCTSEADCVSVCKSDAIMMQWVEMDGNIKTGKWTDEPPPQPIKKGIVNTLVTLFEKPK